jgi:hypothetical protein
MTRLVTNQARLNTARQIIESVSEPANTVYYLWVGDHTTHSNSTIQPVYDTWNTQIQAYRNMILGKRLRDSDMKLMIRNIPYESNTVYTPYDDSDSLLFSKNYFAIVNAGAFYHVFKCLENNGNSVSTVEPDFAHILGSNTFVYQTSDGYKWKYMYSVDDNTVRDFETANYFPVVPNTSVEALAVTGTIDSIAIDGAGQGYDNYANGVFDASDIKIGGNPALYGLSNTLASTSNGFYTGCLIYLTAGTGSGQFRTIDDYYANTEGKYFVIGEAAFNPTPDSSTRYEIFPEVDVNGGGKATLACRARALINAASSNSVYRVEILQRGAGYEYHTASVIANTVVDVEANAIVRPIYSPTNGHGADAAAELGSHHLGFSITLTDTESNTIPTTNKFQQIGILQDPLFANVLIEVANTIDGNFGEGEYVYEITPVPILYDVTTQLGNTTITSNTAMFESQFTAGEWIYLTNIEGTDRQLTKVASITSDVELELETSATIACTSSYVYKANVTSQAIHTSSNATHMYLDDVNGQIIGGEILVGNSSGALATVNTVFRNGEPKTYDTFVNMYKYDGTVVSGTFDENEVVFQSGKSGLLHSSTTDGGITTIYTSNQVGLFTVGSDIVGANSGTALSPTVAYSPELVFNSGYILYVENTEEITRSSNTSSETFQFIFEF